MTTAVHETPGVDAREAWLRERRNGIGASEVGTILGLNPYSSAYELWTQKTSLTDGPDETFPMWFGRESEPIVAKRYEMETGRRLIDRGDYWMVRHPDYEWLRATPDRLVTYDDGVHGAVELKAIGSRNADEWSEVEAPLMYQAQLQIQLACLGYDRGEIAAVVGNHDFYILEFERNPEFLDAILPTLYEFWECCQNGTPPEIDGSAATARAIKKLHPLDNGESVDVGSDVAAAWHELQELKAIAKETQDEIQRRENIIRAALGDNTYGEHCGVRLFSHKAQTRRGALKVATDHLDALRNAEIPFDETKPCTYRVLRKAGK